MVILPSGDIVPCHEPRPELTFGNLRDEGFDGERVNHHLAVIKARGCQPCGICSNAFTEGAITV
jgi:radical SAM protein with 4Fe4S-binding SPASM domain